MKLSKYHNDETSKKKLKLLDLTNPRELLNFLKEPTIAISEFLTGALSSGPSSYVLSAGKIVQGALKGKLLEQFGNELKQFRDSGKIKEDYLATNKNQVTMLELLKFIDNEIPEEELLKALKSIFLNSVSKGASKKDEEVAYQLLILCKKLNSMDILILKTCFNIYTGKDLKDINTGINSHGDWVTTISIKIGYDLPELIHTEDNKLVELGFLSGRNYSDKSGIIPGKNFRLTNLGIKLCKFITGWDLK